MINVKKRALKYYPFLPLLLLCVFYGYKALNFPIHDFSNYYFGGKFLADGTFTSSIYLPYEFNTMISNLGYSNIFASYAPNTPFLAFLFVPFSFLSATTAKLIFNCVSIVLFITAIYRLFSFYRINPKWALLIPVLFLVPIKNNLLFGQVYFLLFFLMAEGWLAYEHERFGLTALLWSLAIMLKVFPIALLVFLVFKKKGIPIFYLIGFCLLFFGISVFFTGIDIWGFYFKEVLPKASNGEIANSFVDNYQSVFMFLKRIFIHNPVENPHCFLHNPDWLPATLLAFKVAVLFVGFFISGKRFKGFYVFSFWILAMLLISPYGSTYGLILLVFPFFALLDSDVSNVKKIAFGLMLFLICNLPLSIFIDRQFPLSYLRLFLLLVFFIGFAFFECKKSIAIKAFLVGCLVFFIGTFFENREVNQDQFYEVPNNPILIYDFRVKNNQLTYFYWDEKGKNSSSIPFKAGSVAPLEIKQNQIMTKFRRFANDQSHKLKPLLIDNKTILFLSDYDRGIGFYTLRKINL